MAAISSQSNITPAAIVLVTVRMAVPPHYDTSCWLDRQQQKLLPVNYFMVTFTLPAELRAVTARHQKVFYDLLMNCAHSTLKTFAGNHRDLDKGIGMTAVVQLLPAGPTRAVWTTVRMYTSSFPLSLLTQNVACVQSYAVNICSTHLHWQKCFVLDSSKA
jgi:hypothetical protein